MRVLILTCAAMAACCAPSTSPHFRASGLEPISLDDGGLQADGGTDGGWAFRSIPLNVDAGVIDGNWAVSWFVRALGPEGLWAGDVAYPMRQDVWVGRSDGRLLTEQDAAGAIARVSGIGAAGRFCGWRYDAVQGSVAIVGFLDGGAADLMPGASVAVAISPSGDVVAQTGPTTRVFWRDGGSDVIVTFDYPDGGANQTLGYGINDLGEIVGIVSDGRPFARGSPVAFAWTHDGGTVLQNGSYRSSAYAVNNGGEIVGSGETASGHQVPMAWSAATSTGRALPLPPGIVSGEARAITERGLIVGTGQDSSSQSHGLIWWLDGGYLAEELLDVHPLRVFSLNWAADDYLAAWATEDVLVPDAGQYLVVHAVMFQVLQYPR